LHHPLVRLAREIDWGFLDRRLASVCAPGRASPACRRGWCGAVHPEAQHNLSDEVLCARWLENPYYHFLLRRTELLSPAAVRPFVTDASGWARSSWWR
jgi:hypothetical protein